MDNRRIIQTQQSFVAYPQLNAINNLTSWSTTDPLSANMGRVLKELIDFNWEETNRLFVPYTSEWDISTKPDKAFLVMDADGVDYNAAKVGEYKEVSVVTLTDIKIGDNLRGSTIKFLNTNKNPDFSTAPGMLSALTVNNSSSVIVAGTAGPTTQIRANLAVSTNHEDAVYVNGWSATTIIMKDDQDYIVTSTNFRGADSSDTIWGWTDSEVNPSSTTKQLEIGSEHLPLNLNGLNERPWYETTESKKEIALIDDLDNYAKKEDIPVHTDNVIDITAMFNIDTTADFSAFLFKRDGDIGTGLVKIHSYDNSESSNNLTITPELGFGPNYTSYQAARECIDGVTFTDYAIKINAEDNNVQGTIEVPNGVKTVDINYYLKDQTVKSYYITTDNVMHPFELDNTPISNFYVTATSLIINNENVLRNSIKEIVFGDSYLSETSIGNNFLRDFSYLTSLNLKGLSNIITIGNHFLYGCYSLQNINLDVFLNVTSIGNVFMYRVTGLTHLDFSWSSNLQTIGSNFLISNTTLTEVTIGSVDWSTKTLTSGGMGNTPNVNTSNIYADSILIGEAFKQKMNGSISNWTIVTS